MKYLLASCAWAALVAFPVPSFAQKTVFVEGLFELTAAVEGTFGDEGRRIAPALDKMARALAEWDRAIRAFETRVVSELPNASTRAAVQLRVTLAGMYAERGRRADALRELDAASRLEPQRADAHVLRGHLLSASTQATEAGEAFRMAWSLDAGDPIKSYRLLQHAAAIGQTTDVQGARESLAAAYRKLLADGVRAKPSRFVGVALFEDSVAEPLLPVASYARGYAHLVAGDYHAAIAEIRRAAAIDPLVTDPAAQSADFQEAVAALREGRLSDARARLERSEALRDSSEAHRVLGLIYWAASEYTRSIEQLSLVINRNPGDERSRLALSRVLSTAGRDADAERALQETIRVLPESVLARWWLGRSFERTSQLADARREFEHVAAGTVAGRSQLYAAIGRFAAAALDLQGAGEAFARSVTENPNDATAHKLLAGALLQQDRADDAFVEFVAALLIDPQDAGAYAGIGQIQLTAGRYDEAVVALRRAVDLSANHTGARYALATALMRLGHTQEAAREFDRVQQTQRQLLADRRRSMSLDVLLEEAALRAAEGNVVAAIDLYERAVALGTDPAVYGQLADLYAKVGRLQDAVRARAAYETALQRNPASQGSAR